MRVTFWPETVKEAEAIFEHLKRANINMVKPVDPPETVTLSDGSEFILTRLEANASGYQEYYSLRNQGGDRPDLLSGLRIDTIWDEVRRKEG